jgi:hypothetical protein
MPIGVTSFNQIRDINGYVSDAFAGNPISDINQCFTLTATDAKTGTAPTANCSSFTVIITVSPGADVFFLPEAAPDLAAPDGTVTSVEYQLINNRLITQMVPNQAYQFLYNSTPTAGLAVTVHMAYYANITDNQLI